MTYVPHTKVTFSGIFGNPAGPYERWSFGLALAHDDGSVITLGQGLPDSFSASALTFLAAVSEPAAKLTLTKVANVGADGKYVEPPWETNTVPAAGDAAIQMPPQVALAVSLWPVATTFRPAHGRFYIPAPIHALETTTGLLTSGMTDVFVAAAKTFLNAVSGEIILPAHVVVPSKKLAGHNYPVTQVRVGRAFDTIRSRRRSLKEQYHALDL